MIRQYPTLESSLPPGPQKARYVDIRSHIQGNYVWRKPLCIRWCDYRWLSSRECCRTNGSGETKRVTGLGARSSRYPSATEQEETWPKQPHDSGTFLYFHGRRKRVTDRSRISETKRTLYRYNPELNMESPLGPPLACSSKTKTNGRKITQRPTSTLDPVMRT